MSVSNIFERFHPPDPMIRPIRYPFYRIVVPSGRSASATAPIASREGV